MKEQKILQKTFKNHEKDKIDNDIVIFELTIDEILSRSNDIFREQLNRNSIYLRDVTKLCVY